LGNAKDNVGDRDKRGRQARGESQGKAKLTEAQALEIREHHVKVGISQRGLARKYNVDRSSIISIITRKGWKHI
jgi:hypothetical protein